MHFNTTEQLLRKIEQYVSTDQIKIQETTAYLGNAVELVTIMDEPRIGFEVAEDSVIFYFFSDHIHFDDYCTELEYGEPNYLSRAEEFVDNLFTLPIRRRYIRKGTKVVYDQSWFVHSDGEEESIAGVMLCSPGFKNLFASKEEFMEIWQYDKNGFQWKKLS